MATFTLRLPDDDYEALQAMSLITGRSMADLTREAVQASISYFAASPEPERLYGTQNKALREAVIRLAAWRAGAQ